MPTANEVLENRDLTGTELKQLVLKEVERMLDRDAMFSSRLSYNRAAYRVKVQLFLPMPNYPEHTAATESQDPARNERDPKKKLLTRIPHQQASWGRELQRTIDSPNLARLENGLPITIQRRNPESGRIEEVPVYYETRGMELRAQYPDLNLSVERELVAHEGW